MTPPTIRPSSMPALRECPRFASSGEDSEFTGAGTLRHQALKAVLEGRLGDIDGILTAEDLEGVLWSADYVRATADLRNYPLELEKPVTFLGPNLEEYSGTADVVCGPDTWDLKWREISEYREQMASYRLSNRFERGLVHVMFAQPKRVLVLAPDDWDPRSIVDEIINHVLSEDAAPSPCSYCNWCVNRPVCPALTDVVNAVTQARPEWQLETYHASEIRTADQMGKALTIARKLQSWCEAIEHFSGRMVKGGVIPTGFELKRKAGRANVGNLADALALSGLDPETFFAACDVRMNTPKKRPNAPGLVQLYAAKHGIPTTAAKRELTRKLASVIERAADSQILVSVSGPTEDETD